MYLQNLFVLENNFCFDAKKKKEKKKEKEKKEAIQMIAFHYLLHSFVA